MEYTLLILLLLIMIWINLRNKISKSQEKTEELLKEIAALRKRLENSPEVVDEIKEPEPEILKEPEVFVQPEPVRAIVEPAKNPQPQKVRKPVNYEKYIGENLFGKIGILILVNQYVFEFILIIISDLFVLLQKLDGSENHIVEIHCVGIFKKLLIALVRLTYRF